MEVKPFYPYYEIEKIINLEFELNYHGQDWEIVNADPEKIDLFIEYYLSAKGEKEKITMFSLLIASIDDLEDERKIQKYLNRIEQKVCKNIKIHLNTIIYWALIGSGKKKDHIFMMTNYMRSFLNKNMNTDKIRIREPSLIGIELNGINLFDLLDLKNIEFDFWELIKYINLETDPENSSLEVSEDFFISCEKEEIFTHFEVWSQKLNFQYFKIKTKELDKEIKNISSLKQ